MVIAMVEEMVVRKEAKGLLAIQDISLDMDPSIGLDMGLVVEKVAMEVVGVARVEEGKHVRTQAQYESLTQDWPIR